MPEYRLVDACDTFTASLRTAAKELGSIQLALEKEFQKQRSDETGDAGQSGCVDPLQLIRRIHSLSDSVSEAARRGKELDEEKRRIAAEVCSVLQTNAELADALRIKAGVESDHDSVRDAGVNLGRMESLVGGVLRGDKRDAS